MRITYVAPDLKEYPHLSDAAPDFLGHALFLDSLVSERDGEGVISVKFPLSWETVARMALDFARADIRKARGEEDAT